MFVQKYKHYIEDSDLQNHYIDFYICFRKYVWTIPVVQLVVCLETEVYRVFPDVKRIYSILCKLKQYISYELKEDEDLEYAFQALFKDVNDPNVEIFKECKIVKEVPL